MNIILTNNYEDLLIAEPDIGLVSIANAHFVAERGDGVWRIKKNKLTGNTEKIWNSNEIYQMLLTIKTAKEV